MTLPSGWKLEIRYAVGHKVIDYFIIADPVPIPRVGEIIKDFHINPYPSVGRVCYNYAEKKVYATCY